VGRRLFDVTHDAPEGWADAETPFTFVTDGIETAIEKAKAAAGGNRR
jgi:dihydrofolate reductase